DLDVVRAGQDAEAARTAMLASDEALRRAREQLGAAVGVPEELAVDVDHVRGVRGADLGCRSVNGLEERADIAAADEPVAAADRAVDAQTKSTLPTLGARVLVDYTNVDRGPVPPVTVLAQGVLTVPLFDDSRYGAIAAARADRERATETRQRAKRDAV